MQAINDYIVNASIFIKSRLTLLFFFETGEVLFVVIKSGIIMAGLLFLMRYLLGRGAKCIFNCYTLALKRRVKINYKLLAICVLFLCLALSTPALASESNINFNKGIFNLIDILKYVLIVATALALIKEICTKRNLLVMLGLLFVGAAAFHFVEPLEFRDLGNSMAKFFTEEKKTPEKQGKEAGKIYSKEKVDDNAGTSGPKDYLEEGRGIPETENVVERSGLSPVKN